jgi:hypothetical protein
MPVWLNHSPSALFGDEPVGGGGELGYPRGRQDCPSKKNARGESPLGIITMPFGVATNCVGNLGFSSKPISAAQRAAVVGPITVCQIEAELVLPAFQP